MADQASDFIRQSQAMAEQSWAQWMRYLQAPGHGMPPLAGMSPMAGMPPMMGASATMPLGDVLERSLAGVTQYMEWMQRAAASQAMPAAPAMGDWQSSLKDLFGAAGQPFTQAFSGIDSTAAQGFVQQWQAWLAAAGQAGAGDWRTPPYMPGFGLQREQQAKQQALLAAMMDSAEQQRRYQALILKANAQGLERLQDKLADHVEPGRQIESLKALYDLWIDAAEEAYAEIALGDEFREVYGAMVNAQMRERQLMQEHLEDLCRQLGLPTRSEIDSLGRRLQEVRRELRARDGGQTAAEVAALRAELAALKREQAAHGAEPPSRSATPTSTPRPAAERKGKSTGKAVGKTARKTGSKTKAAAKAPSAKPAAKKTASARPAAAKPATSGRKRAATRSRRVAASKATSGSRRTIASPGVPAPRRAKRK